VKSISLKELHQHTGKHARQAAHEPVLITDRGEPIAVLGPPLLASSQRTLPRRFTLAETIKPKRETDSSDTISRGRDER
jgi:antitoxin (DNA-binding transcriptional repressor) of toxin-antitoxin stability system